MKLAIVILAFNEEQSIGEVVQRIPAEIEGVDALDVFVVDDGSTDGTRDVALRSGAQVLSHGRNKGLAPAFATGIDAALMAGADVIVTIDGDGQHPPERIPFLLAPIARGEAEFVTATRFASPEIVPDMPAIKKLGNRIVAKAVNLFTGEPLTDVSCGFRAYSREAALNLNLYGSYTYTHESLVDLAHKGVRLAEVPISIEGVRRYGESRVVTSVWRYGWRTLAITLRAVRDRMPLQFFGSVGAILLVAGIASELTVLVNWLLTGRTSPLQSLTVVGAALAIIGTLSVLLALMADMLGRQRRTLEALLYFEKRRYYDRGQRPLPGTPSRGGAGIGDAELPEELPSRTG